MCDALIRQRRTTSKAAYLAERNEYLKTLTQREEKIAFRTQPWAERVPGEQVGVLPGQRPVGRPTSRNPRCLSILTQLKAGETGKQEDQLPKTLLASVGGAPVRARVCGRP